MTDAKFESGYIGPTTEIAFANAPMDASTIFADGMKGFAIAPNVTKIGFFEQVLDPLQPNVAVGRFVLNLVIPNDQFFAIADLLKLWADDIRNAGVVSTSVQGIGPATSE